MNEEAIRQAAWDVINSGIYLGGDAMIVDKNLIEILRYELSIDPAASGDSDSAPPPQDG